MKKLLVMRHAKSSWDSLDTPDIERPLNERGRDNAPEMARRIHAQSISIDLVVHSPAVRTTQTAMLMQEILQISPSVLVPFDELYLAEPETLLATVKVLPQEVETVLLLAHNPGVTQFINLLCDETIDNVVTAGIGYIGCNCKAWTDVRYRACTLIEYDYPKNKKHI